MLSRPLPARRLMRRATPFVACVLLVGLVAALVALAPHLGHITPGGGLAALALTAASFWALGNYDVTWHRIAGVPSLPPLAHRSGMAAIAIGQFLGATGLTSAAVRRACLPDLRHRHVVLISIGIALSFSACWSLLALVAIATVGETRLFEAPAPYLVTALIVLLGIALIRLARQNLIRLPDALRLMLWTALDLTAAAAALYVLLPASVEVSAVAFWGAFVLALGAGILSQLPGGIGVFEAVLIACLPGPATPELIASIAVFRAVYFALPFGLALLWINRSKPHRSRARVLAVPRPATPASWGLAPQSGHLLSTRHGAVHAATTPLGLVSLGDPQGARIETLVELARQCASLPAIYEGSARLATTLRRSGWQVAHVADEAVIAPARWSLEGRAHQGLRRKLRHARSAGIDVRRVTGPPPLARMTQIAQAWASAHGGEMGFSMGRYSVSHVASQEIFLIMQGPECLGFVTFHAGPHDWTLDLIRYEGHLPDGAMHLAVVTAIEAARQDGLGTLSLAAVPPLAGPLARIGKARAGLRQFKQCFAPTWRPLYHAAPSRLAFGVTAVGVTWGIQRPVARLAERVLGQQARDLPLPRVSDLSFLRRHAKTSVSALPDRPSDEALSNPRTTHDKPSVKAA